MVRPIPPGSDPRRPPLSPPAGAVACPRPGRLPYAGAPPAAVVPSPAVRRRRPQTGRRPAAAVRAHAARTVRSATSEVAVPDRPLLAHRRRRRCSTTCSGWPRPRVSRPRSPTTSVAARRAWANAPLVLVGADLVGAVARAGLPAPASVLVVRTDRGTTRRVAGRGRRRRRGGAPAAGRRRPAGPPAGRAAVGPSTGRRSRSPAVGAVPARRPWRARWPAPRPASAPALLVDADPLGGGLDLAMGAEAAAGLRWPHLAALEGRTDPHELTAALPCVDGVSVLSWHRGDPTELPPAAMDRCSAPARRGHDLVVATCLEPWTPRRRRRCRGRRRRAAGRAGRDPGHRRPPARSRPGSRPAPPTCGSWSAGPHPAG